MPLIQMAGKRFGRLRVLSFSGMISHGRSSWLCACDCGNQKTVPSSNLRNGTTRSCGCLNRETRAAQCRRRAIHKNASRKAQTPTYLTWCNMIQRCTNPKNPNFSLYGGRGIRVCDEWRDFPAFLRDMGERPEGLSIDRIHSDGPYAPGNCKWSTQKEQCNNKRNNRRFTLDGKRMSVSEISAAYGIPLYRLKSRLYILHMSPEEAVSTPLQRRGDNFRRRMRRPS